MNAIHRPTSVLANLLWLSGFFYAIFTSGPSRGVIVFLVLSGAAAMLTAFFLGAPQS